MRPIWKGAITFGLVNIPVSLFPATRREELSFRMLREKDLSPINYKRVAEADGKEVQWNDIVKGYEYEKGKYVVLKDDDFRRVDLEAAQTVDIVAFVDLDEVNPVMFHKPYFMEPNKQGDKAYVLLRDALKSTGKIGIAKVVIRTREHLAAVKPQEQGLMLELMHFAQELVNVDEFKTPRTRFTGKKELDMAKSLIASMTKKWNSEDYSDGYKERLEKMIDKKLAGQEKEAVKKPARKSGGKVIDLAAILQESLNRSTAGGGAGRAKPGGGKKSGEHPAASKKKATSGVRFVRRVNVKRPKPPAAI